MYPRDEGDYVAAGKTDELWEEFAVPLRRFILARVGNGHDADDVLQEVFLKAHVALARIKDREKVRPWLYRIAQNTVADHFRARGTAPVLLAKPPEPSEETGPANVNGEVLSCFEPMIEELPEGYRRALVLADLGGRTQGEVAEALGLSLSGAKSRVQRARAKLRTTLLSCCRIELDGTGNVVECERKEKASLYCS